MPAPLPSVEIIRKDLDVSFDNHAPVLVLRWTDQGPASERLWELPDGFIILSSPPKRFALRIQRLATDCYTVRLVWEHTQLYWTGISRLQLLGSSLSSLLAALGMDLWSLLEQPLPAGRLRPRAA